jgi:hypothetical protein
MEDAFAAGRAFFANDYATLGGGGTRKFQLVTPTEDAVMNLCISVHATADVTVALSEGADRTAGTGVTARNKDRNSAKTSAMTISHTPTGGTTDGTQIQKWATPSGGNTMELLCGWEPGRAIQLKRNSKYVVLVTDVAGGCNVSTTFHWTEEIRFTHTTTTTTTTTSTTSTTTTAP